jgi:hypothetical protein
MKRVKIKSAIESYERVGEFQVLVSGTLLATKEVQEAHYHVDSHHYHFQYHLPINITSYHNIQRNCLLSSFLLNLSLALLYFNRKSIQSHQ